MERRQRRIEEQETARNRATVSRGIYAVDETLALIVGLGKVQCHFVALDGRVTAHPDLLVQGCAVVIGSRLTVVSTVRNLLDYFSDTDFHPIEHFLDAIHHRVAAILVEQRDDAVFADLQCCHQRIVVDAHAFRETNVIPQQFENVLSFFAFVETLDRRYDQAFSVNVESVREITTRKRTARVHLMAARKGDKHQFVLIENRTNEAPVGEVIAATVVGVVCDYNVARMQVVAEFVENVFDTKMLREKH